MGMSFVSTYAWTRSGVAFDWEAGDAAVDALNEVALMNWADEQVLDDVDYDNHGSLTDEGAANVRASIREHLKELRDEHDNGVRGYLFSANSPDNAWTIYMAGGMSFGDDPSEVFTALRALWEVPEVMRAIGFYTNGDDPFDLAAEPEIDTAAPTAIFLIRSTKLTDEGSLLWWSNEGSWSTLDEAVVFTADERRDRKNPRDGEFVEFIERSN